MCFIPVSSCCWVSSPDWQTPSAPELRSPPAVTSLLDTASHPRLEILRCRLWWTNTWSTLTLISESLSDPGEHSKGSCCLPSPTTRATWAPGTSPTWHTCLTCQSLGIFTVRHVSSQQWLRVARLGTCGWSHSSGDLQTTSQAGVCSEPLLLSLTRCSGLISCQTRCGWSVTMIQMIMRWRMRRASVIRRPVITTTSSEMEIMILMLTTWQISCIFFKMIQDLVKMSILVIKINRLIMTTFHWRVIRFRFYINC